MKKNAIRLTLKSYDYRLLDDAVRQIVVAGKRTGARMVGPVPIPNKTKLFTVLRSPHVDKKARDQFKIVTHKRIIDFIAPQEQTMDALMRLSLSAGVDVKID
jgi:small subunit ribosomal protein S10